MEGHVGANRLGQNSQFLLEFINGGVQKDIFLAGNRPLDIKLEQNVYKCNVHVHARDKTQLSIQCYSKYVVQCYRSGLKTISYGLVMDIQSLNDTCLSH